MRVQRYSSPGFGANLDDEAGQRMRIPKAFGAGKLAALVVANDSQQDQFLVMPLSQAVGNPNQLAPGDVPIGRLGVRQPFFPDTELAADLILAPYGLYPNVALVDPPTCLALVGGRSGTIGQDRYIGKGAYASVVAYYGRIPPCLPIRRDPMLLECFVRVTDVNRVCFRIATPGRDKAAITLLSEPAVALTWGLYGCTESMNTSSGLASTRERDLLASGAGDFSLANLDSFDSYELEGVGPAAAINDYRLRFTAWDS